VSPNTYNQWYNTEVSACDSISCIRKISISRTLYLLEMTTALTKTQAMELIWQYLIANNWNKHKVWNKDAWRKILMYPNMPHKQPGICSSWNNFFVGTVQENCRLFKTVWYTQAPRKWRECKSRWHDDSQWHYAVYKDLYVRQATNSSECTA
jgi:hypothetical protein